jgi:hypothetical protein
MRVFFFFLKREQKFCPSLLIKQNLFYKNVNNKHYSFGSIFFIKSFALVVENVVAKSKCLQIVKLEAKGNPVVYELRCLGGISFIGQEYV